MSNHLRTIFGRDALRTLWMTKPSYVPWKAQSPWKARPELTTFAPGPSSGTGFSEIPCALRFVEIAQSFTTSFTPVLACSRRAWHRA